MRHPLLVAALAIAALLTACDDGSGIPKGDPRDSVHNGVYGADYGRTAVTTDSRDRVYWAQQIVSDYRQPGLDTAPSGLVPALLSSRCRVPGPSFDAAVYFVEIGGGGTALPLRLIRNKNIDGFRAIVRDEGRRPDIADTVRNSVVKQVDIFVTERRRPVFLVLAAHDETLWSLQILDGATIEGIAVVGHQAQAVAHRPADTDMTVTIAGDAAQRACSQSPRHPVTESWDAVRRLEAGQTGFAHTIDGIRAEHAQWRAWIEPRTRVPDRSLAASETGHVLIGPLPTSRFPYRPLTGATVEFSPTALPIWGDTETASRALHAIAETPD